MQACGEMQLPREMRERVERLNFRLAEEYVDGLPEGSYKDHLKKQSRKGLYKKLPYYIQEKMAKTKVSLGLIQVFLAGPSKFLTPEQEQWLFRELRQRKAFEQSKRQGVVVDGEIWTNHRKEGFSFDAQHETEEWEGPPENQSWRAYSY